MPLDAELPRRVIQLLADFFINARQSAGAIAAFGVGAVVDRDVARRRRRCFGAGGWSG